MAVPLPVPDDETQADGEPVDDTVELALAVELEEPVLLDEAVDVDVEALVRDAVPLALLLPLVELEPVEDDVAVLRLVVLTVADVVAEED